MRPHPEEPRALGAASRRMAASPRNIPPSRRIASRCSSGRGRRLSYGTQPQDQDWYHTPPILLTIFHSSAVTGCTDRREYFTSAMSASRLSALIAAIVTAVFNGLSALMSTQTNLLVASVGSG